METSYLKAHPLRNRYPEWTPNHHSDRSQDSNPCALGSQGLRRASGSSLLHIQTKSHSFLFRQQQQQQQQQQQEEAA